MVLAQTQPMPTSWRMLDMNKLAVLLKTAIPGRSHRVNSGLCAHKDVKVNGLGDVLRLESCVSGPPKVAEQGSAGSGG